jgi:hypothetical protein
MMASRLDKATSDKVSFLMFIVPEFALAYKMQMQDAFFLFEKVRRMGLSNPSLVGVAYR